MVTAAIKWNEGEGNIVATYEGSGNEILSISSDVANEGIDRSQVITVRTTRGKVLVSEIQVSQPGLREVFCVEEGAFLLSDGETFNVLKDGVQ